MGNNLIASCYPYLKKKITNPKKLSRQVATKLSIEFPAKWENLAKKERKGKDCPWIEGRSVVVYADRIRNRLSLPAFRFLWLRGAFVRESENRRGGKSE